MTLLMTQRFTSLLENARIETGICDICSGKSGHWHGQISRGRYFYHRNVTDWHSL